MAELKVYNCHNSTAIFCIDDFYKVRDVEPILNSLQQLKAEIAALVNEHFFTNENGTSCSGKYGVIAEKLRQLSAV